MNLYVASPVMSVEFQLRAGQTLLADKAYDAGWIREAVAERGAKANIPNKSNRKNPFDFNAKLYKERNQIERFFGHIKRSFRSVATRYDKYSAHFLAMIKIASIQLWCEFYKHVKTTGLAPWMECVQYLSHEAQEARPLCISV